MKPYEIVYKDEDGCKHEVVVTATDVRVAIDNTFELYEDCRQVIRAFKTPVLPEK